MLKTTSINISYDAIQALYNVSIHIKSGEFVALIGSNGAGKTTLLNSIMGLVPVKEGNIYFNDREITGQAARKKVKSGMALVPEGRRVFPNMSVFENLEIGGYQSSRQDLVKNINLVHEMFPVLSDRKSQMAGMLSGGEQQMLAIGRALVSSPRLLLMDEPSMGLAPLVIKDVYEKLNYLKSTGLTIFLVEQNASMALRYADRGYVLEHGKVILQGKSEQLLGDNEIKRAYLGKEYKEKWER